MPRYRVISETPYRWNYATYSPLQVYLNPGTLPPPGTEFEGLREDETTSGDINITAATFQIAKECVALVETVEPKPTVEVIKEEVTVEKVVAINLHLTLEQASLIARAMYDTDLELEEATADVYEGLIEAVGNAG